MGIRGFESDVISNYADGVITSIQNDNLPANSVALGRNTKFHKIGPGVALLGTRDGFDVKNETQLVSGKPIQNLHYFKKLDSGTVLLTTQDGSGAASLYKWSGSVADLLSAGYTDGYFSFLNINNFALFVNGADMGKTDGVNVFQLGIDRPNSADWTAAAVAAGTDLPAGDYDVLITYYNANTNHEGPRSVDVKTVTIAGGERLRVVLPSLATVADAQVTHARIYIRQQTTSNQFFSIVDGTTPAIDADVLAFALDAAATTTVLFDTTQDTIDAFTTLAPGENENLLDPATPFKFIVTYRQRVIACDNYNIYWTPVGKPEGFNTVNDTEPVGVQDGEAITGMIVHDDTLIIFKRNRTYYLDGDDPETWVIRTLDPTVGNIAPRGFGVQDGSLYFLSLNGPQRWKGRQSPVEDINTKLVGAEFQPGIINFNRINETVCIRDNKNNFVAWSMHTFGEDRQSVVVPFNTQVERWMSSGWDCIDIDSSCQIINPDGSEEALYGDHYGNLYTTLPGKPDGIPFGTTYGGSSQLLSHSNTSTEIKPDISAANNSLIGRYIWIWRTDNDGTILGAVKRRITANTDNVLTLTPALTTVPVTDGGTPQTWKFSLGGIMHEMRTGFRNGGNSFYRKRIEFLFAELTSTVGTGDIIFQVFRDLNDITPKATSTQVIDSANNWDEALWDIATWDGVELNIHRVPVHTVGHSWQTRLLYLATNGQLIARKLGIQWLTKTKKAGRGGERIDS
jgi:hypothetical protein